MICVAAGGAENPISARPIAAAAAYLPISRKLTDRLTAAPSPAPPRFVAAY